MPYGELPDLHLFWEEIVAVTGDRRHHRVGDAAYDRAYNLLYDRFPEFQHRVAQIIAT